MSKQMPILSELRQLLESVKYNGSSLTTTVESIVTLRSIVMNQNSLEMVANTAILYLSGKRSLEETVSIIMSYGRPAQPDWGGGSKL